MKAKILNNIVGKKYTFNLFFPLNCTGNSKKILDSLAYMNNNNNIKPRITNRMCGTCHRSLYYLVQCGIEYFVNPEQGLGNQDNFAIKKCFKDIKCHIKKIKCCVLMTIHYISYIHNNIYNFYINIKKN